MRNALLFLSIGVFTLLFTSCNNKQKDSIKKMAWLEGQWVKADGDETSIENWTFNSSGFLMGKGVVLNNGDTAFTETMSIEVKNSNVVLTSTPSGKAATGFKLTDQQDKMLVFENLKQDFPQKITYWQEDDSNLYAKVEGKINGKDQTFNYNWKKN
jgi:hypothetical protein